MATKLNVSKLSVTARTKSIHSSMQAEPSRVTNEPSQRVPPVNCGAAKPPK